MLTFGRNDKMKKTEKYYLETMGQDVRIHTFNLPAIEACPGAGNCKSFCYATQGRYIFRSVAKPREDNFNLLKENIQSISTLETMLGESIVETFGERRLGKKTTRNIIRIHDSGDFFHKNYFIAWCNTMANLGMLYNIEAYAYTKSLRIIRPLMEYKPNNLHIIFSVGGLWDSEIDETLPHSKVFLNEEELTKAGYVDGSMTDIPAIEKATKIGLIYHGTKGIKTVEKFIV